MGNRISRNVAIILRSERLIARRRIAALRRQAGMVGAAAILGAIALVMFNLAGYLALSATMDPAWSALIVALANLLLAGLLIAFAGGQSAEKDVQDVCEVRDMAVADLEGEIEDAAAELRELTDSVRRMARDPLSTVGGNLIGPLIAQVLKQIRK